MVAVQSISSPFLAWALESLEALCIFHLVKFYSRFIVVGDGIKVCQSKMLPNVWPETFFKISILFSVEHVFKKNEDVFGSY